MDNVRRELLKRLVASAAAGAMPASINKALAIPAHNATGTIADVEHIVILMQENRSFDHYLGTLRGVRGFSDPRVATLTTGATAGQSVFYQPGTAQTPTQGYTLPFHPAHDHAPNSPPNLGLTFLENLAHDWQTTHQAWNHGQYDSWILNKTAVSMAYLTRNDIPFHYALADAFTVCDAYYASQLGSTHPNRLYMWTGWVGNDGKGGGPAVANAGIRYTYETFPEKLTDAGVTWKVYQDVGNGLTKEESFGYTFDALIGNFGDNALLYFKQFQEASPNSTLYKSACTGTRVTTGKETLFDKLEADIQAGRLPQVSWVVSPEAYSEHPDWPANYGAYYVSQVLDALTSNPSVWSKTALIITYDENDGFFDHMIPPTPPVDPAHGNSTVSTAYEYYPGTPPGDCGGTGSPPCNGPGVYGLGIRVPCFVVSPWSKGGYVNSQVFDHTSLIRFIQAVFGPRHGGLVEPNITPWRQAVCGDMTTAFNFRTPNVAPVQLPSTTGYAPPDGVRQAGYPPKPPTRQSLPRQEKGMRRARALPYEMTADAVTSAQTVDITFTTTGLQTVVFQVRTTLDGQRSYTVEPGKSLAGSWTHNNQPYDLSVSGPNGFLRRFKGDVPLGATGLRVQESYIPASQTIALSLFNGNSAAVAVLVTDAYSGARSQLVLQPGQKAVRSFALQATYGWYDLSVTTPSIPSFGVQLAGHLENGKDFFSDPMISPASA